MTIAKKKEQITEHELIERILKGEKLLYETIVRRYNPYLYKVGRSYNYNHDDTQDLMQDTYVDAFKNLGQYEQRSNFKTWITRIMLNNCYKKKQKFSFKNETTSDKINDNAVPMYANTDNETAKIVDNNELASIIENSLNRIPEDYRMVFSLREMNGFNVEETANLLGISESNVKVRLNRAKTMLKMDLEKTYKIASAYDFHAVFCDPFTARIMRILG